MKGDTLTMLACSVYHPQVALATTLTFEHAKDIAIRMAVWVTMFPSNS